MTYFFGELKQLITVHEFALSELSWPPGVQRPEQVRDFISESSEASRQNVSSVGQG